MLLISSGKAPLFRPTAGDVNDVSGRKTNRRQIQGKMSHSYHCVGVGGIGCSNGSVDTMDRCL